MKSGADSMPRLWTSRQRLSIQPIGADHGLEADRPPGDVPDTADDVQQVGHRVDIEVPVGGDRIPVCRDAADPGDFLGDLGGRQNAALARLGALAELELEHPDLLVGRELAQPVVAQIAVGIAHAVFRGADLEHEIAAALEMVRRQPAFAGVEPAAGERGALRQRLDRRLRYRAEAHAGNVDHGLRDIGLSGVGADGQRRRGLAVPRRSWETGS